MSSHGYNSARVQFSTLGASVRFLCALVFAVLSLFLPISAEEADVSQSPESQAVLNRKFDVILELLWSPENAKREDGMQKLQKMSEVKSAIGPDIGVRALRAAARSYPYAEPKEEHVTNALMSLAGGKALPEYIPVIMELFDKYNEHAQGHSLIILNDLESRDAAEAYVKILRKYAQSGKLTSLQVVGLAVHPRYPAIFFPEIFNYLGNEKIAPEIYDLTLHYCEAKMLSPAERAPCIELAVKAYVESLKKFKAAQIKLKQQPALPKVDVSNTEGLKAQLEASLKTDQLQGDVESAQGFAGLMLDLFGYFPMDRVESYLREALEFKETKLNLFALVSLIRNGVLVDQKYLERVAGQAETRIWLYESLNKLGVPNLFPKQFLTQKAFAEADMVGWLSFGTELGKVPDEIELMKVVSVDTGLADGFYDYYVFRFRTHEPHWAAKDGWMAGISGPFLRSDHSSMTPLGDTFSTFKKWGEMTPEQLVGDNQDLMKKWREYHLKKKD